MNIHHWLGSLRSQTTKIHHRLGSMRARADHGGAIVSAAILKYSSPLLLTHPFLLASLAWQSLHSDGQRQIPTLCLLLARQLSACPQTDNFEYMFCECAWSLAPIDIRNP